MTKRTTTAPDKSRNLVRRLFVYGTLKRGQANSVLVEPLAECIDPARVRGRLLDLGFFPGMIPGDGEVFGELVTFPLRVMDAVLAVVDDLEGFTPEDPAASLFIRERIVAQTEHGETAQAFAYFYNSSHPDSLREEETLLLESGHWDAAKRHVRVAEQGFLRFTRHVRDFVDDVPNAYPDR